VFDDLRLEGAVRFVDIYLIVDYHCFSFLS
jgi:hypothetical protein